VAKNSDHSTTEAVFKHTVLEINLNKEYFTHHGLHPNEQGGKSISELMAVQLYINLGKRIEGPISLGWESELKEAVL
jgi:hypothetical protein